MAFPETGLFARYEALLQRGVTHDTQLQSIPDLSGASTPFNLFVSSTPGRYRQNVVNGQPAYYLTGSGYYQASSNDYSAIASSDPQVTIAAIVNSNTPGTTRSWPFGTTFGESGSIFAFTDGNTPGNWGYFARGAVTPNQVNLPSTDDTQWTVLTMSFTGSAVNVYLNGDLVGTHTGSGLQQMDRIRFGNIVNQNFEGYIAGAYIWKRGLSQAERADFHSYVQDTYGIQVADYVGGSIATNQLRINGQMPTTLVFNNQEAIRAYLDGQLVFEK